MTQATTLMGPTHQRVEKDMVSPLRFAALVVVPGVLFPGPTLAYIGPGAGLGALAVTAALVFGLLLLVIGLVWYPLKRLLKRRRVPPPVATGQTDRNDP